MLTAQVSDLEEAITEATQQSTIAAQQLQQVRLLVVALLRAGQGVKKARQYMRTHIHL